MSFDWIVEGRLLAMAMPWPEDLAELRRIGVTAILSLDRRADPSISDAGFAHRVIDVRDFTAPTPAQLDDAAAFIDTALAAGGACAVHCGAGLGRTGTVAAVWLVRHGSTAADAIAWVRRCRPGSIETAEQEAAILADARAPRAPRGGSA